MSTENDLRLTNLATTYGTGTRSYNRSAEKREMDRQRKEATERYKQDPRPEYLVQFCSCRSFQFPHELERHKELRSENDWSLEHERPRKRWEDLR